MGLEYESMPAPFTFSQLFRSMFIEIDYFYSIHTHFYGMWTWTWTFLTGTYWLSCVDLFHLYCFSSVPNHNVTNGEITAMSQQQQQWRRQQQQQHQQSNKRCFYLWFVLQHFLFSFFARFLVFFRCLIFLNASFNIVYIHFNVIHCFYNLILFLASWCTRIYSNREPEKVEAVAVYLRPLREWKFYVYFQIETYAWGKNENRGEGREKNSTNKCRHQQSRTHR